MISATKRYACISFLLLASTSLLACSSADANDENDEADTDERTATVTQAATEGETRTRVVWTGTGYYRYTYTFIDGQWVLTSKVYCDMMTGMCGGNTVPPPEVQ